MMPNMNIPCVKDKCILLPVCKFKSVIECNIVYDYLYSKELVYDYVYSKELANSKDRNNCNRRLFDFLKVFPGVKSLKKDRNDIPTTFL